VWIRALLVEEKLHAAEMSQDRSPARRVLRCLSCQTSERRFGLGKRHEFTGRES
jgi:hypothetical protein